MRIIIRFRSGFELPVTCDKFVVERNSFTGEITHCEIEGIKDNKPIFFLSEDIECIFSERQEE